nr:PREDICTED: insulin-like growth factor-binding protein 3 receptor isoform X3 [Rhinolophus sinicus]
MKRSKHLSGVGKWYWESRALDPRPGSATNCGFGLSVEARTPLLPMGSCQAGHNLHFCLAHHPPLVCATLILLLLGLSGLGLGGYLLTPRTTLRSPDIPQDWVTFLRSFSQLTLCPVTEPVTGQWHGSHVVGLVTTLNFGDGPDINKTQTFQAQVQGSQMGLKALRLFDSILGGVKRWARFDLMVSLIHAAFSERHLLFPWGI